MRYGTAIAVALFLLDGCARRSMDVVAADPPGFLISLWHGMVAPFALVGHFFDSAIRVYAFPNSAGWYDLGFLIGVGGISGAGVRT